jgi:hypothetical protein
MATLLHVTRAFILVASFFPGLAAAHGSVALEEDPCARRVGGNVVHFNAYQPQYEATAQYCTEIPAEGDTFLVVDLVDPGLRNLPVGVQVVQGGDEVAGGQTVAYWPPALHPDGVVRGEANLSKGFYKLIITAQGFSPSHYLLRVQQIDYGKITHHAVGPLTILLLLGVILYELSKSKRLWKWRVSSHS